jgi:FAD/FMN-containing dehydrogenase
LANKDQRNDAPNGLMVSVKHMKGIQVLENPEVKEEGFPEANYVDDSATANVVSYNNRSKYAVTVGAGVTTQELNDALEPSRLFSVAAAHGNITVAGGWVGLPTKGTNFDKSSFKEEATAHSHITDWQLTKSWNSRQVQQSPYCRI